MNMRLRLLASALIVVGALAISPTAQGQFVGEIDLVAFNFAPANWALCDGSILPITQNVALFSLIGTTFGGDGVSTFALPDLRGRRAIGMGQGPGLGNYTLGESGGEEQVTLTVNQLPAHFHSFFGSAAPGNSVKPGGNYWASASQVNLYSTSSSHVAMAPQAIGMTGGSQPHDNRSPYLAMNYIISLFGFFPSQ
jgi:microcystin-dependent protein